MSPDREKDDSDRASYRVARARRAAPPPPRAPHARGPAAIFVAHGQGQQIPFQTLEAIAEGLSERGKGQHRPHAPVAKTVSIGGERLQRLELQVSLDANTTREVHVYEGYWAPFTEGQVKLRDVTAFLFRSAWGGIQLGLRDFHRWMFGRWVLFPAPVRAVLYLLLALGVVVALAFLNAAIMAIAAARAPMQSPPAWLSDALFQDVTTVLNALISALAPLAIILWWSTLQGRRGKQPPAAFGFWSVAAFILALVSIMVAAILVAAAFVYHAELPPLHTTSLFGTRLDGLALRFDRGFDVAAAGLVLAAALFEVVRFLKAMCRQLTIALSRNSPTRRLTMWVLGGFLAVLLLLVVVVAVVWAERLRGSSAVWRHGLAWPAVIAVGLVVRSFLIQYAGDVAAYIQPQSLDRFFDLRVKIKDVVGRTAKAIYGDPQYHDIILVGHSLGSVVVYDVLNRLILDRQLAGPDAPEIVQRTRALITFGSPLDKTAFIFGTQGTGREAREALAASVQPLITDEAVRPRWVNIWSPWDIISGSLDYYDLPRPPKNRNPIENIKDGDATTLLVAHVQYWNNRILFDQIRAHLG